MEYTSVIKDEETSEFYSDSTSKEIKPGTTLEVVTTHKLPSREEPIEVEVQELISLSEDKLVKTFNITE